MSTPHPLLVTFFTDSATSPTYALPLHDALPILPRPDTLVVTGELVFNHSLGAIARKDLPLNTYEDLDRKSTRLNSSHVAISYAVFCLKKKNSDHAGIIGTLRRQSGGSRRRRGRV